MTTDLNPAMAPPNADEIHAAIKLRLELLRPLVEEHARLEQAEVAIDRALRQR